MHNQPREPQPYEDCQAKSIQEFGWTSQGMDWGGGQGIKSTTHRRVEEFGYSCVQRRLTRAKRRRTGLLPSGPKSSSDESKFCISFGNQGPRVWRKGGEAQSPSCLKSSVKFPSVCDDLGVNVICWCWSIVLFKTNVTAPVYQDILEHFILPSAEQLFKDANYIFQQDSAPAHTAKSTRSWLNDHGVGVLDWPVNSPDLNPGVENLWGIVKRKMRNKRPKQFRWAEGHCQRNLGFIPPQQCHKLITSMPRRIEAVIKAKGAPTKYWVHI